MQISPPTFREWRLVAVLQVFFLLVALVGLDAPFVSMHFVRQTQTFDVANHVFHEGWSAVFTPKASFSQLSSPYDPLSPLIVPAPRFTIIHLEVPFHGLIGWPTFLIFGDHERAIVRLVSVAFAMLSIGVFYLVLRHWLEPYPALAGTALWTTTPLILHFGQVPTPDILATTGMAVAFLFALRGNIAGSSGAFLFAILAKLSIIIYGLPILVALLIARDCRSLGQLIKISFLWGIVPLLGLLAWLSLSRHDPPGSWVVYGGFRPGNYGPLQMKNLLTPKFYFYPLMYAIPAGFGILGAVGLLFALGNNPPRMNLWLKRAIIVTLLCNYSFEEIVWHEPQYTVPVLFWVWIAASLGLPRLFEKFCESTPWKVALTGIVVLHLLVVCGAVMFLKASRVPNLPDMQAAAQLTPPDARIVVYASTANTSPPVWLKRNTLQIDPQNAGGPSGLDALAKQLANFQKAGFDYLMVFDMELHHRRNPMRMGGSVYATDYTNPSSPTRQFFDGKFRKIFEGDHVVLYSLGK